MFVSAYQESFLLVEAPSHGGAQVRKEEVNAEATTISLRMKLTM